MSAEADCAAARALIFRAVITVTTIAGSLTAALYSWFPWTLPAMPLVTDRLVFTLRWNSLTIGFLLVLVGHIGNTRFFSAQANPLSSVDKDKVEIHCRVLQNSLEQFLLSFVLQLSTVTWLEEAQMKIIPIVVVLFLVGRVLFWRGYLDPYCGHARRAYGLPLTMFTNLGMLIYCIYKMIGSSW